MRVGQGFDVHAFGEGDKVVIGGVVIPHTQGLVAHSDGDVLLHALCDALLGAAGLGDIGLHFPDTDPDFRNVDSRSLLSVSYAKVQAQGWKLKNADLTVIAQAPRMAPHCDAMVAAIANTLNEPISSINVKATTTERLGFTGRGEGIAAMAVVLLDEK